MREPARRIVSLVPSLSELVCALGAGRRLVGVTRYCTHPPALLRTRTRVGGTKNPDCAAIVALRPDVVLANVEENRDVDIQTLVATGLNVFVTFPKTVADAAAMIERIGRLIGTVEKGTALASRVRGVRRSRTRLRQRRVRVFCPIWRNPWMAFNADTYAHDMLRQAGADNVCAGYADRYPQVTLDEVAAQEPEVVLLPSEPYRFTTRHVRDLQPLQETPAVRNGRVHLVDGQALSWYGPRTPAALQYFRRLIQRV